MEPNGTTALERVTPEYRGLTMVVSPAEAMKRLQQLQSFVKEVMVPGVDYGTIPGVSDKECLFKPGAEKLCEIYGFAPQFETVNKIEDWDKGLFHYEMRCRLVSRRDGSFIADGVGSCNSKEKKYAGRWVFDNEIPAGVDKKSLRRREGKSKKNGKPYQQFFVANDDIFSLVNTIEKMACKRAMVAAVIGATRSAGIFTQDLEDIPPEAFGKPEREPVAQVVDPEAIEAKRKALFETIMTAITSSHSLDQLNEASKQLVRAKNDGALLGPQISLLADEGKARKAKLEQDAKADPDAEERAAMQEEGGADAS